MVVQVGLVGPEEETRGEVDGAEFGGFEGCGSGELWRCVGRGVLRVAVRE
jgi:hypothetical protein